MLFRSPISGGQGGSGAWGRRGSPELLVPRRRVTGEGQSGALGVGLGRGLAGEVDRGMRNPLEWKAGCCGGRSRVHGVEAARRGGTSPAGSVRAVPALGSAGKGVCAHAQDATRPKIRPAGPNAQRRGARRGAAALGRRRAGSGPKGCTAAYTIVPKRTSGRSRSSPSFGLKRRPAQSARRQRPAAEVGRSSWRS